MDSGFRSVQSDFQVFSLVAASAGAFVDDIVQLLAAPAGIKVVIIDIVVTFFLVPIQLGTWPVSQYRSSVPAIYILVIPVNSLVYLDYKSAG